MVELIDLIEGVKKEKEIELFDNVGWICNSLGGVKNIVEGKSFMEYDTGEGIIFGHTFYNEMMLDGFQEIWIKDNEKNNFLIYTMFKGNVSLSSFNKIDFSKMSNRIFEKVDECYKLARED